MKRPFGKKPGIAVSWCPEKSQRAVRFARPQHSCKAHWKLANDLMALIGTDFIINIPYRPDGVYAGVMITAKVYVFTRRAGNAH